MTFPPKLFTKASSLGWASRQGGNSLPSPEHASLPAQGFCWAETTLRKAAGEGGTPLFCFPDFFLKSETLRLAFLNRNRAKAFLMGQA